jgi:hypothetical protein
MAPVVYAHRIDEIKDTDDDDPADVGTVVAQNVCVRELECRHLDGFVQVNDSQYNG